MSFCCKFCAFLGRGLCDELITRPEESCRLWCVVVCDLQTSWMRRPWPIVGCYAKNKQTNQNLIHEQMRSRLKTETAYYHSVHGLLSWLCLQKYKY